MWVIFFNCAPFSQVNSASKQSKPTAKIFKDQENEKKRPCLYRVLEVENRISAPLVCRMNGGMGVECTLFL